MSDLTSANLDWIDSTVLDPIVQHMVGSNSFEIDNWRPEPLVKGSTSGANVYRLAGVGRDQGETLSWSLILKVEVSTYATLLDTKTFREEPTHADYWKRELLLYQSDLFSDLPEGFGVPRCYHIEEQPHIYSLWQEDVSEQADDPWPLDRYGLAARHLGRFNGIFQVKRAVPAWSWLVTDLLRQREQRTIRREQWRTFSALRDQHPIVQRGWPLELAQGIERIWRERDQFFRTLEQLPRTFQHHDTGRKNLLSRLDKDGHIETVFIDWGMAGTGAIGEDLAPLVCATVLGFGGVPPEQLPDLDQIAFAGFIQGLHDVGWRDDPSLVRLGYLVTVALRFGPLTPMPEIMALDEERRAWFETIFERSIEEIIDNYIGIRRYVIACADEARLMMGIQ